VAHGDAAVMAIRGAGVMMVTPQRFQEEEVTDDGY
jgi:hypothetical protein